MSKNYQKRPSNLTPTSESEEPTTGPETSLLPEPTEDIESPGQLVVAESPTDPIRALLDVDLESQLKALRAEVRRRENEREELRPRVGSRVRILRGRPKYVGQEGTAVIVRRSRCFVSVPGLSSPAYALITDIELLER